MEQLKVVTRPPNAWYNTQEAGDMLGLTTRTVANYIKQGIIRAERRLLRGQPTYFITGAEIDHLLQVRAAKAVQAHANKVVRIERMLRARARARGELGDSDSRCAS